MKNDTKVISIDSGTVISLMVAVFLVGGAFLFFGGNKWQGAGAARVTENVSIVDGKQIITIRAKGGYTPKMTTAKADLPTVFKIDTQGTFDCSAALIIPSLRYRRNLPSSGEILVDVPPQKSGATVRGLCAMGMYSFSVRFNGY